MYLKVSQGKANASHTLNMFMFDTKWTELTFTHQVVLWRSWAPQQSWHPDLERRRPPHPRHRWGLWGRYWTIHLCGLQQSGSRQHVCWGLHWRSGITDVVCLWFGLSVSVLSVRTSCASVCVPRCRSLVLRLWRRRISVKVQIRIRSHVSVRDPLTLWTFKTSGLWLSV